MFNIKDNWMRWLINFVKTSTIEWKETHLSYLIIIAWHKSIWGINSTVLMNTIKVSFNTRQFKIWNGMSKTKSIKEKLYKLHTRNKQKLLSNGLLSFSSIFVNRDLCSEILSSCYVKGRYSKMLQEFLEILEKMF